MSSEANSNEQAPVGAGGDGAGSLHALLAEFEKPEDLIAAARQVRDAGYSKWDTHTPFPVHGIDAAMGIRHTKLPWLVFLCGLAGAFGGLAMQWWMNATHSSDFQWVPTFLQGYDYLVSGKPLFSLPANIPVTFETTVLLSAFAAVFGMLVLNNLPNFYHALFTNRRFQRATADRFFVVIEAGDPQFEEGKTRSFLESLGGRAVERVEHARMRRAPRWMGSAALILVTVAILPPMLVAYAHVSKSSEPRIHPIQDMDNQGKYKAQHASPIFEDGRAMRPKVEGAIARGDAHLLGADADFHTGRVDGEWVAGIPDQVTISMALLERGREQFGIYCAPCHGVDGSGNGIVAKRVRDKPAISTGWVPPTSMHDQLVKDRPVGHIFNTITNGIRTMPPYGTQISASDRWAIVAYIRALERSRDARIEDVPAERRSELR